MSNLLCRIKSLLMAFSLIVCISCFGYYTFAPVASMTDYQLQNEYLDIQRKLGKKQQLYFGGGQEYGYSEGEGLQGVSIKRDIDKLESRLDELNLEMSKRGIIP